jgi:hypothetical protein
MYKMENQDRRASSFDLISTNLFIECKTFNQKSLDKPSSLGRFDLEQVLYLRRETCKINCAYNSESYMENLIASYRII